jgi:hypothetical protein
VDPRRSSSTEGRSVYAYGDPGRPGIDESTQIKTGAASDIGVPFSPQFPARLLLCGPLVRAPSLGKIHEFA